MKKVSVLIIDDSDIDYYLLSRDLEALDYDIRIMHKANGQEAVDFFTSYQANKAQLGEDFPPLIIFLDINMPLMNGLEFLEAYKTLQSDFDLKSTCIMMFTSSKNPKDIESSLDYDYVSGYLVKGEYTEDDLLNVVNKVAV